MFLQCEPAVEVNAKIPYSYFNEFDHDAPDSDW